VKARFHKLKLKAWPLSFFKSWVAKIMAQLFFFSLNFYFPKRMVGTPKPSNARTRQKVNFTKTHTFSTTRGQSGTRTEWKPLIYPITRAQDPRSKKDKDLNEENDPWVRSIQHQRAPCHEPYLSATKDGKFVLEIMRPHFVFKITPFFK